MTAWVLTVGNLASEAGFRFEWNWHSNLTYFCPQCNRAWAHAKEAAQPIRRNWHVITTLCPYHPWDSNLDYPGDLFLPFENEYNDAIAKFALPWINKLWARHGCGAPSLTFRFATFAPSPQDLYYRWHGQREDPLPPDRPGD